MSGLQLTLTAAEAGAELELVDGELVASAGAAVSATALFPSPPPDPSGLGEHNLFAESERIAARAASASTRRQYGAIFRSFGDWLAAELGRPPLVGDLDADVLAAYGRHLALAGGRGGRPAAPATARVYLSMLRVLARELGRGAEVDGVRIARHEPGPPETLTDVDYANLLRVPDRRTLAGKRDHALLRVLGGLRLAVGRATRPARSRSAPLAVKRQALSPVRPRQGRVRARSPVPEATQQALEAWTAVHPLARGVALLDEQPLFVRLGRHPTSSPSPCRLSRCTGSCAVTALQRASPSASRTHTPSAPTGPPAASRPASRSTRSPPDSGTSTCAPPPDTQPRAPSASTRSPRSSIGTTRPRGEPGGGRRAGRGRYSHFVATVCRRLP